jgi:hypothetical protein
VDGGLSTLEEGGSTAAAPLIVADDQRKSLARDALPWAGLSELVLALQEFLNFD